MPRRTMADRRCSPPAWFRFNEAGAKCPGEPAGSPSRCVRQEARFNEAGAKCPGERYRGNRLMKQLLASMRPGRNAPENAVADCHHRAGLPVLQ